jgi:hypothetical protein
MKALISPNEQALSYDGSVLGQRIAQVEEIEFPIASPLFWVDCPNDCKPDLWYYLDGQCIPKPLPPEPDPQE